MSKTVEEPGNAAFDNWPEDEQHEDEFPPYIPSRTYDQAQVGCEWSHSTPSRRFWEYLILTVVVITPIEVSYVMIFDKTLSPVSYIPFFLFDVLQMVDNFVLIKNPISEHGILVTDPWKILERYGRIAFIIHCITSLPLGWIGLLLGHIRVYFYLSLARLFRLHRGYEALIKIDDSSLYTGTINHLWPYFLIFAFVVHVFACTSYMLASIGDTNNSYITPFINLPPIEKYVASLYFVTTAISTIGYGDIVPRTTSECMIVLAMEIFGVSLQAWLTAKMVNALSDHEGNAFLQRYDAIQNFLKKDKKVDRKYSNHVRHYYQCVWEETHGTAEWRDLLDQVPESIRNGIKLELCERAIFGMELWRGMTNSEMIQLIDYLEAVTFIPEEVICTQHDTMVSDLFIFTSGSYRMLMDGLLIGRQTVVKPVFDGERELIFKEARSKTLIAETFVECWRLKRASLLAMVKANTKLKRLLSSNARRKYPREFSGWNRRGHIFAAEETGVEDDDVAIVYPSDEENLRWGPSSNDIRRPYAFG